MLLHCQYCRQAISNDDLLFWQHLLCIACHQFVLLKEKYAMIPYNLRIMKIPHRTAETSNISTRKAACGKALLPLPRNMKAKKRCSYFPCRKNRNTASASYSVFIYSLLLIVSFIALETVFPPGHFQLPLHSKKTSISPLAGITRSAPFFVVIMDAAAFAYTNICINFSSSRLSRPYSRTELRQHAPKVSPAPVVSIVFFCKNGAASALRPL